MQVVLLLRHRGGGGHIAEALSPQGPHRGPRSQVCRALTGEPLTQASGCSPDPWIQTLWGGTRPEQFFKFLKGEGAACKLLLGLFFKKNPTVAT